MEKLVKNKTLKHSFALQRAKQWGGIWWEKFSQERVYFCFCFKMDNNRILLNRND